MAHVSIRKVVKMYEGDVQAVKGIDLEITDHEFVVLVGPSGCGKSTTLRMIAGLEEISAGEISIGGTIVNDVPPRDRDIAMVFQNYALYPHMSVFDNMAFGLKLRKFPTSEIKHRVDEAARILDITPLLDRKPKALSGGQRQRVAMGRAIVRNPTTVYVTHDQIEAMTLADRVVVMNHGVIEQVGPPQELYHNPATRFVAGFIGSPAMNFMPCTVVQLGDGLGVKIESTTLAIPAARKDRYAPYKDKKMTFGIRPEHLTEVRENPKPGIERMSALVDVVEPMGMETMVHFHVVDDPLCARIAPNAHVAPNETLEMHVDMNNMHLLDPESGKVV